MAQRGMQYLVEVGTRPVSALTRQRMEEVRRGDGINVLKEVFRTIAKESPDGVTLSAEALKGIQRILENTPHPEANSAFF